MKIAGVLFDKDGTLIDVHSTWIPIYRRMLQDVCGIGEAEAVAMMERAGFDSATHSFKAGSVIAAGTTRQLVEVWWPDLDSRAIDQKVRMLDHDFGPLVNASLAPLMPLEPIFTELRSMGLKLGIATNDSHVSATSHMNVVGIIEHLEDIIAADTVPVAKPSGNMIRRFAEVTGLSPSAIAMVGDNSHDMEEARNGGAGLAIAVLSGNAAHGDIAHLADYTIESVAELPALLRSL